MAGNHITEQHIHEYQGPVQPELLNMTPYEPQAYYLPQNYQLDSPNNFKVLNILLKTDNVTNKVTNALANNILNQEYQDYYNWWDQQYIACKYDGGVEQVTLELVPDILLEEEKTVFINGLTIMINGIISPTQL